MTTTPVWVIPLQAVEAKQFGVFAGLTGDLNCFNTTRDNSLLGWSPPGFDGWFKFGDTVTVDNKAECNSASITILLANGNKPVPINKNTNTKLQSESVPKSSSDPMMVVLNETLETLLISRPSLGMATTKGDNECNLVGTQYLFGTGTTIYLPLDKNNCPKSAATGAQLQQLESCESTRTIGNPNNLEKSTDKNWLVLGKIQMTAGLCYQLSITAGSISPIKIKAVDSITSAPSPKMELQTYQWRQRK